MDEPKPEGGSPAPPVDGVASKERAEMAGREVGPVREVSRSGTTYNGGRLNSQSPSSSIATEQRGARIIVAVCPVCGAGEHTALHAAVDRWMGGPGAFAYARCMACGLTYLRTRPATDAFGPYYPSNYVHHGRSPAWLRRRFQRHDLAPKVALVRSLVPPGTGTRLLDVGCADGAFLDAVRSAGIVPAGVEPVSWAVAQASARGLPIWHGAIGDVALPPRSFEIATLWDVIEHLDDPVRGLRAVSDALATGGRLLISTPVLDGWEAHLWGEAWPGWDTPRHLQVYSRATLADTLDRAGFRVESWHWVQEGWLIHALAMTLAARERLPAPLARVVRALLHMRPLRELLRPLLRALDRRLGGCAITVVASKLHADHKGGASCAS